MQLNHTNAYSLDQISNEYKQADLQPSGKKQMVTDEEVFILLDHTKKIWPYIFWGLMLFSILFVGMVGK